MAYIRLPLGIRVALEYEVYGKVVVNVYHVTTTDPILTAKLFDIADFFAGWWENSMSFSFSEDISLHNVTAQNLDVPNGEKVTFVVSPPWPGNSPNEAVSNNVAIVASFATALTGRSFRGRAYHAGLTETSVAENEITPALAAILVTYYGVLVTTLQGQNTELVVASFQSAGAPRLEGIATDVESIGVNLRVDTQRRRLPRS